jgi:hypothetical protein
MNCSGTWRARPTISTRLSASCSGWSKRAAALSSSATSTGRGACRLWAIGRPSAPRLYLCRARSAADLAEQRAPAVRTWLERRCCGLELLGGFALGAHVTALAGLGLSSSQCRCTSFHGRLVETCRHPGQSRSGTWRPERRRSTGTPNSRSAKAISAAGRNHRSPFGEQRPTHPRSRQQHQPRQPKVVVTSSGARARVSAGEPGPALARLGPRPAGRAPGTPRVARAAPDPRLARPCRCGVACRSPLPDHQVYSPFA